MVSVNVLKTCISRLILHCLPNQPHYLLTFYTFQCFWCVQTHIGLEAILQLNPAPYGLWAALCRDVRALGRHCAVTFVDFSAV